MLKSLSCKNFCVNVCFNMSGYWMDSTALNS